MKTANILSLSGISTESTYKAYLDYIGTSIKEHEAKCLRSLCVTFQYNNAPIDVYDGFYVSYSIPQISKEFDLLRIGSNRVVNIELKTISGEEKILRQLIRNKYYLSYLNRSISLFAFVMETQQLYRLTGDMRLEVVDILELIAILQQQNSLINTDLDELFNPSNYLVSPFNSTKKFLYGKYFLTGQQEKIEAELDTLFKSSECRIAAIGGKPGTGKTLLLYHYAKKLIEHGLNVLIIHTGNLNEGHITLRDQYGWRIISVKSTDFVLKNAVDKFGKSRHDYIIVDETQRMNIEQLNLIIQFADVHATHCIIGFDPAQVLCWKEMNSKAVSTIKDNSDAIYVLSEKIRTNKELAQFIRMMFNLKRKSNIIIKNVSVIHFTDLKTANQYIETKSGYTFITYTPSQYSRNEIDSLQCNKSCSGTSHSVIGQEFDNVLVVIDSVFYYDDDLLKERGRSGNPYLQIKMLYQAVTRVRRKLEIVVVNNFEVFEKLLMVLNSSNSG